MIKISSFALVSAWLFSSYSSLQATPEIEVSQGGRQLSSGSQLSRLETLPFGYAYDTFTIRNTGTISLTGIAIRLSGAGATHFVTNPEVTSLEPSQERDYVIEYIPKTSGAHTVSISIASNDADESPFRLVLNGSDRTVLNFDGLIGRQPATPQVVVNLPTNFNTTASGLGSLINAGSGQNEPTVLQFDADPGYNMLLHSFKMAGFGRPQPMSFIRVRDLDTDTVLFNRNGGTLPSSGFTAFDFAKKPLKGTNLVIEWQVAETAERQDSVGIDDITYSQSMPEISVQGNRREIVHTSTVTTTENGTHYGPLSHLGAGAVRSFTLRNLGNEPLAITNVALSGAHAADFSILQMPPTHLAVGASFNMPILCKPNDTGRRVAEVVITSNDYDEPSFVFSISCHGGLPTAAAQSIVFTPPNTVYEGDSALFLKAISTADLPITYTLISGPAILSPDNDLNFTGPGVVKIMASQPGEGRFSPAKPVTATINVLPRPTTLTLADLTQVYDGSSRAVRVLGGSATVTYDIDGLQTQKPPIHPGSYNVTAVAGTQTLRGKLVITKAPLFVRVQDETKFEGQPNPRFSLSYSGFIDGDSESSLAPLPTATTKATQNSPSGLYPITVAGAASANYALYYIPGTLQINGLGGGYEGLMYGLDMAPAGKISLAIAAGRSFSASVSHSLASKRLTFKGTLSTEFNSGISSGVSDPVTVGNVTYKIRLSSDNGGPITVIFNVNDSDVGSSLLSKIRVLPKKVAADHAGAYTLTLNPPSGSGTRPEGAGYATGSVSATGVLKIAGKLGDGVPFTASMPALESSAPGYVLFAQPYSSLRRESFIAGSFTMTPSLYVRNRRVSSGSTLSWRKVGGSQDATYRDGFGLVTTALNIVPWFNPTSSLPPGQGSVFTTTPAGFYLTYSSTGSASEVNLPATVTVSRRNVFSAPTPNLTRWTAKLNPASGLVQGSFELQIGTANRKVPFAGVMTQFLPGQSGRSHFILPSSSSTESTTGELLFYQP